MDLKSKELKIFSKVKDRPNKSKHKIIDNSEELPNVKFNSMCVENQDSTKIISRIRLDDDNSEILNNSDNSLIFEQIMVEKINLNNEEFDKKDKINYHK